MQLMVTTFLSPPCGVTKALSQLPDPKTVFWDLNLEVVFRFLSGVNDLGTNWVASVINRRVHVLGLDAAEVNMFLVMT